MTEDGGGVGPGSGPPDRDDGALPPEMRHLDEELRGIRFDPRPGLEDEVLATVAGRSRERAGRSAWLRPAGLRRAGRAAAVLAAVATVGLLTRANTGGGSGTSGAPTVMHEEPPPATGEFTIRWGPDARVLALGAGVSPSDGSGEGGIRCGRMGDRLGCRETTPGPAQFAAAPGPAVLRDFCCLDYDGGGPADDGVRVVAGQGEAVVSFWIYEDRDGTGDFSDGDLLRTVVDGAPSGPGGDGPLGGVRRLDRCCADLDGGPRADDGLFVLASGGERVALAVLYEDMTGDGRLSRGDRLRALRTTRLEHGPETGADRVGR